MLRRKPTALTITSEDIAAFETLHAERIAQLKFLKTGEDPLGQFSLQNERQSQGDHAPGEYTHEGEAQAGTGTVDPNDELRPLPGDKARIVRGREERIVGGGGGVPIGGTGRGR